MLIAYPSHILAKQPPIKYTQKAWNQPSLPSTPRSTPMIKHGQQPGEQPTGMWGSTWSVPGTTSNTLSWLRVSRMYRSFSGHISRHVPTKVLALSRSVLFTRAKQNQVKSKNVPYRYWEAREVHFHNDKRRNKNKNSLTKEKKKSKKHYWASEKESTAYHIRWQAIKTVRPSRPSLSGWVSNSHRSSGHSKRWRGGGPTWVFMAPAMTLMMNNQAAMFCSKNQSLKRKYSKYASIPKPSVFHHVF